MFKNNKTITFIVIIAVGIVFLLCYAHLINNSENNIQKYILNKDKNSKQYVDDKFKGNLNNYLSQSSDNTNNNINSDELEATSSSDRDNELIFNYKGGDIEPEWEWVKTISFVYTWVDGNDVDFLDVKSKYNGGKREYNSRDRSADELRYSIRSITKYLPWYNGTIFILTNNQIPKWLNTTNPRVQVVFHKDIFPEHVTPTYDSSTIELYLDKIPGLTERFIYFNDDFFINNYIHPAFFFTSDDFFIKVYRRHKAHIEKDRIAKIIETNDIHDMFQASKYFTNEIIHEYFDKNFVYLNACHIGYVFYRDLFEPFRQIFKEEVKILSADRFRSPFKPHFLYLYHTFVQYSTRHKDFPKKLGGDGRIKEFGGFTLPENRTIEKYSALVVTDETIDTFFKFGKINDDSRSNNAYFNLFKTNPNILVYNLNDVYTKEQSLYEFTKYMITRYPDPTEFEKKEYVQTEQAILPIIDDTDVLSTDVVNSVAENVNVKYADKFKGIIEQYKLDIVKDYIDLKDSLSGPRKQFSRREIKEADALLKYSGKLINKTWEWAQKMSFVYILKNASYPKSAMLNKLKISIRSLDKYLPWFNGDLFIVTQKKVTNELSWLNTDNIRIHIINQDQIIPNEVAHTQNVHIIEMYFDKIPGISERFVYLKDNHYFVNYTHPRFFFNKEFYPKYNFKNALNETEISNEKEKNKAFFNTYDVIRDYFGFNYVTTYRYLKDAPYPFYRDLFEPCRKLYESSLNEMLIHTNSTDILPLYLVTTYNIYGTEQPYYPEYVAGYGRVREVDSPDLNEKRTIDYYGFDITSPYISDYTMMLEIPYNDIFNITNELTQIEKLFISLDINDEKDINNLMETLFPNKSSFEI